MKMIKVIKASKQNIDSLYFADKIEPRALKVIKDLILKKFKNEKIKFRGDSYFTANKKVLEEIENFLQRQPFAPYTYIGKVYVFGERPWISITPGQNNKSFGSTFKKVDEYGNTMEGVNYWLKALGLNNKYNFIPTRPEDLYGDYKSNDKAYNFQYFNSEFGDWEDMELTIMEEGGKYQWIEGDGAEESDFIFNTPEEAIEDYKKFVKSLGNKVRGL